MQGAPSAHRQIERAFFEGQQTAVFGARALNKRCDVEAFVEHALGGAMLSCALSRLPVRSTGMNSPSLRQ